MNTSSWSLKLGWHKGFLTARHRAGSLKPTCGMSLHGWGLGSGCLGVPVVPLIMKAHVTTPSCSLKESYSRQRVALRFQIKLVWFHGRNVRQVASVCFGNLSLRSAFSEWWRLPVFYGTVTSCSHRGCLQLCTKRRSRESAPFFSLRLWHSSGKQWISPIGFAAAVWLMEHELEHQQLFRHCSRSLRQKREPSPKASSSTSCPCADDQKIHACTRTQLRTCTHTFSNGAIWRLDIGTGYL